MNQYFFEVQTREKLGRLRQEGQASQAVHRSRLPSEAHHGTWPRLIAIAVSIAGGLLAWIR